VTDGEAGWIMDPDFGLFPIASTRAFDVKTNLRDFALSPND
jgi:hypothetical protein